MATVLNPINPPSYGLIHKLEVPPQDVILQSEPGREIASKVRASASFYSFFG
jgi:hypothetical protein